MDLVDLDEWGLRTSCSTKLKPLDGSVLQILNLRLRLDRNTKFSSLITGNMRLLFAWLLISGPHITISIVVIDVHSGISSAFSKGHQVCSILFVHLCFSKVCNLCSAGYLMDLRLSTLEIRHNFCMYFCSSPPDVTASLAVSLWTDEHTLINSDLKKSFH